jgi:hypothetical protein
MAFTSGETYWQYVPTITTEHTVLQRTCTWPNAMAVLTNPAALQAVRLADAVQATIRRSGPYDGLYPLRVVISGTAAMMASVNEYITNESRTPSTRIALHRALSATSHDIRVQRIFMKNYKAMLAR